MAQTSKELIDAMIAAEAALRADGDAEISAKVQNAENEADANAARESAGAEADYTNYQNPTDVRAAALARLGLNGRISETAQNAAYNAYRSRLAAAAEAQKAAKEKAELAKASLSAQSEANTKNAAASANALKNSDYWKLLQWEYGRAADKV